VCRDAGHADIPDCGHFAIRSMREANSTQGAKMSNHFSAAMLKFPGDNVRCSHGIPAGG